MRSSIALLAASAMGAHAKDTMTTSLFLGGSLSNGAEYAGSVVSVGPSDTVYELVCTATEVCGTASLPQTLTVGPSTMNWQFATETMGVEASVSEACQIKGTASAVCQVTFNMEINAQDVTTSTSVKTTTTLSELAMVPVELTAGVEKLSAATPASAAASSTASASGSSKSSGSANAASSSSTSGASSTMSSGRGGDILAFVMFSAISVSVGALMIL
ncbi:hypothetical protein KCU89_g4691, partial [Aureobasidium melanogenum]